MLFHWPGKTSFFPFWENKIKLWKISFPKFSFWWLFFQVKGRVRNSLIDFRSKSLVVLQKNERLSDLLKKERFAQKKSDLLIRSFLVSDLSDSLMVAHFWWATSAYSSQPLIFGERPERFAQIALLSRVTWEIRSHPSPKKREWENCLIKNF